MIPLEDNVGDILGKAQRGLGFSDTELREQAGLTAAELAHLRAQPSAALLQRVAPPLGLDAARLLALAEGRWAPRPIAPMPGFAMLNLPYEDMRVNVYAAWEVASHRAVLFDGGPDAGALLELVRRERLAVELILITHAHSDHVVAVSELQAALDVPVWINAREREEEDFPAGVKTFDAGRTFSVGTLRIETRLTSGHAPGQTTFVVHGLERRLAIIGDSLFAGSMGGSRTAYREQLRTNREQIFTLPDDTILASGHGPLTTVGEERQHNPFFPA